MLTGLRLMQHGWTQGFAVSAMRQLRPSLEAEHSRILKQDARRLFDEEAIKRNARAGDFAVGNTEPVFVTIVSGEPILCGVCRGTKEVGKFVQKTTSRGGSWSMFEIVNSAHALARELADTEPQLRGRSS